jgi:hypothetical protein
MTLLGRLVPDLRPGERDALDPLPQELFDRILQPRITEDAGTTVDRSSFLYYIARFLRLDQLRREAARCGVGRRRMEVVAIRFVELDCLDEAIAVIDKLDGDDTRAIRHGATRTASMKRLAEAAAKHLSTEELRERWEVVLDVVNQQRRKELVADLAALVPILERLGGRDALAELGSGLLDVAEWFP